MIDVIFVDEKDDEINPLGARGVGEIGIIGRAAAIANAKDRIGAPEEIITGQPDVMKPLSDKVQSIRRASSNLRGQLR